MLLYALEHVTITQEIILNHSKFYNIFLKSIKNDLIEKKVKGLKKKKIETPLSGGLSAPISSFEIPIDYICIRMKHCAKFRKQLERTFGDLRLWKLPGSLRVTLLKYIYI